MKHPSKLPPLSSDLWRELCECNHSAAVHLVECCELCSCSGFKRGARARFVGENVVANPEFEKVREFMLAHGGREFVCPRCLTQVVTRDPSLTYCPPCEATWNEGAEATDAELALAARQLAPDVLRAAIDGLARKGEISTSSANS